MGDHRYDHGRQHADREAVDRAVADDLIGQANRIVADAEKAEREILEIVESKIK